MAEWKFKSNVDRVNQAIEDGAVEGLQACVNDLSAKSQQLCPKKRGYNGGLVSTHEEEVDRASLSMRLRYTAEHAWYQHEKREYKHKPGEQAKYVEQPLVENGPAYLEIIAQHIRRKLGQ